MVQQLVGYSSPTEFMLLHRLSISVPGGSIYLLPSPAHFSSKLSKPFTRILRPPSKEVSFLKPRKRGVMTLVKPSYLTIYLSELSVYLSRVNVGLLHVQCRPERKQDVDSNLPR